MKQLVLVLALSLLLSYWTAALSAVAHTPSDTLANELIIELKLDATLSSEAQAHGPHADTLNTLLRRANAGLAVSLGPGSSTYRVRLRTDADPIELANQFSANPDVAYAEPNHLRTLMRMPADPLVGRQWALGNIHAFDAWDITTGNDTTIALLDTGVSRTHPDLKNKLLPGYDFYNNDDDPSDDDGHGTHTAGVAAADSNNGVGIAGVCWSCKILPVKVLGQKGQGDDATIATGIRWAVDRGARIISMSLGGPRDTRILRDAVAYAHDRNALIIAASGNGQDEGNIPNYPAAYPGVLAVTATDPNNQVTPFSTTGDFVGIAAPGVGVLSTLWDRDAGDVYGIASGTSAACPHVAGAAALVLSVRPDLNAEQLAQVLEASADDEGVPGKDPETGFGRLNVLHAVQLARDPTVLAQSSIQGVITGASPNQTVVSLNTGQQTQPNNSGFYNFSHLPTGTYTVNIKWPNGQTEQQQTYVSGVRISIATLNFELKSNNAVPANTGPINTAPADAVQAFQPVGPPVGAGSTYFPQTQHTLGGVLRSYWSANGGLPVFGYPISEQFTERAEDGRDYVVQYFERNRLEIHPENAPPYNVLLSRLGDTVLQLKGRNWFTFPQGTPQPGCLFFEQTKHSLCGAFLNYWQTHGLELDGRPGKTASESLALFGQPISEPQVEVLADGNPYVVQWFERARFEYHDGQGVLLGLLGNDLAAAEGKR